MSWPSQNQSYTTCISSKICIKKIVTPLTTLWLPTKICQESLHGIIFAVVVWIHINSIFTIKLCYLTSFNSGYGLSFISGCYDLSQIPFNLEHQLEVLQICQPPDRAIEEDMHKLVKMTAIFLIYFTVKALFMAFTHCNWKCKDCF